jgi:hypothetical protein
MLEQFQRLKLHRLCQNDLRCRRFCDLGPTGFSFIRETEASRSMSMRSEMTQ